MGPDRRLDTNPGDRYFDPRWDLFPGAGGFSSYTVNIQDLTALLAGPSGAPPMFGGAPAFGMACPFPP
jgi:hypothetical protein